MNIEPLLKDLVRLSFVTLDQASRFHGVDPAKLRRALGSPRVRNLVAVSWELVRSRAVPIPIATAPKGLPPSKTAGEIAYESEKRWGDPAPTIVLRATAKLRALYGGDASQEATVSLSHEIALAEVLLKKRQENPTFEWKLVSTRPGLGALPDAVSASGELLVELVGRYAGKLVAAKLTLAATSTIEFW